MQRTQQRSVPSLFKEMRMNYGEQQEVAEALIRRFRKEPKALCREFGGSFLMTPPMAVQCMLAAEWDTITEARPETLGELAQHI